MTRLQTKKAALTAPPAQQTTNPTTVTNNPEPRYQVAGPALPTSPICHCHGLAHDEVIASLERRLKALEEERAVLERELERETKASNSAELALLTSIPGVGTKSACYFIAEIGDIRRFSSASKLVAFAGLSPMQFQSGSSVNKESRLSRLGSSELRRLAYMPGLVGIRHNPILKEFYQRLVAHGKSKKSALLACVAKLLRIMYGVLIHRQPFNPNHLGG